MPDKCSITACCNGATVGSPLPKDMLASTASRRAHSTSQGQPLIVALAYGWSVAGRVSVSVPSRCGARCDRRTESGLRRAGTVPSDVRWRCIAPVRKKLRNRSNRSALPIFAVDDALRRCRNAERLIKAKGGMIAITSSGALNSRRIPGTHQGSQISKVHFESANT
jgi:hypothetical protein